MRAGVAIGMLGAGAVLAGCLPPAYERRAEPVGPIEAVDAQHLGIETRLLDNELVSFAVQLRPNFDVPGDIAVEDYARCAAAQYAVIRGYGFTRHVRTLVSEEAGIWRADAVYTISPALPQGERTIDAEVTVADCQLRGIPTV